MKGYGGSLALIFSRAACNGLSRDSMLTDSIEKVVRSPRNMSPGSR